MTTTQVQFKWRRGTAAQWTSANTVLGQGEPGLETDTGRWKLGDATTAWTGLPYQSGHSGAVVLDDFYQPADGGDWNLTLARALTVAVAAGTSVLLTRLYPYLTPISLPAGARIIGSGPGTGFTAPTNTPTLWCTTATSGISNIHLEGFLVDGGVTTAIVVKNFTRGLQFRNVTGVTLRHLHTRNIADWAVSFETCTKARVYRHTHTGGGLGLPGGRDGVHFLDCTDFLLDGAAIDSGDDCVGITSQTIGLSGGTIRNVVGRSDIASIVACNEESSPSTLTVQDLVISGIRTDGTARNIVRVNTNVSTTTITGIKISDVRGTSDDHGVWVAGSAAIHATDVQLSDIDATSNSQHGVYLNSVDTFTLTGVTGKGSISTFDGINTTDCTHGVLVNPRSHGSAHFGLQVFTSTDVNIVNPLFIDCGGVNFAGGDGGGARVHQSTDVTITGGSLSGNASTTSYYGLLVSGTSTNINLSATTRLQAAHTTNGTVSVFGGPVPSASGASDSFTGTNGASLAAQWSMTFDNRSGSGGTGTIQTNAARFVTATGQQFATVHAENTTMPVQGNTDAVIKFTPSAQVGTEVDLAINSSNDLAANASWNTITGYYAQVIVQATAASSFIRLWQGSTTLTSSVLKTITAGTQYTLRLQRVGLTLQAKVWQTSTTEPATWDTTFTLTAIPAVGRVGFGAQSQTTTAVTVTFDDLLAA